MSKTTKEMNLVDIDKLVPYVNNARTHSPEQINKIRSSLREFGFVNPVIIDKDYNIIAGHGRVEAAKQEGIKEVPCVLVDYLTPAQKKAYIIADNRMALDAGWNEEVLKVELQALSEEDYDLTLTGFEQVELDNLLEDKTSVGGYVAEEDLFEDIEKLDKHYGVPYQGNKSRIADIIINILPAGERLVDLFGGGGCITHCAMLSGKWNSYLYNDINPMITTLFMDAVNGKYHDERRVITREDFEAQKDTDPYIKYIWSFGNNGTGYLWGKEIEDIKCTACHSLMDETLNERRMSYVHFIKMLKEKQIETPERLQSIEHLQALTQLEALQRLEALQLKKLEVTNIDYRDYKYQEGDIVYCDIPYEKDLSGKCDDYGFVFDSKEFYQWVKEQPIPIYFSSYEISDDSFYKVKVKKVMSLIGATTNGQFANEYLYSNREIDIDKIKQEIKNN